MAHVLFLHSIRHTMKENKAKHADGFYEAKQRFVQHATYTHIHWLITKEMEIVFEMHTQIDFSYCKHRQIGIWIACSMVVL